MHTPLNEGLVPDNQPDSGDELGSLGEVVDVDALSDASSRGLIVCLEEDVGVDLFD